MSVFTDAELRYLTGGRQLGRIATAGADGTPHVVPVGWIYNPARDAIEIGGIELERSKKFRDIARTGRAAIVVDDVESTDPWRPRGVENPRPGRGDRAAHAADPDSPRADRQPGARRWPQCTHRHEPAGRRGLDPAGSPLLRHAWAAAPVAARLDLLAAVVTPPGRAQPEHAVRPAGEWAEHDVSVPGVSGRQARRREANVRSTFGP
jgi:pyridoxamine 5'-phosphate oxidase family protein